MTRKVPPHFVIRTNDGRSIGCRSIGSEIETFDSYTLSGAGPIASSKFSLVAEEVLYGDWRNSARLHPHDVLSIEGANAGADNE